MRQHKDVFDSHKAFFMKTVLKPYLGKGIAPAKLPLKPISYLPPQYQANENARQDDLLNILKSSLKNKTRIYGY